MKIMNSWKEATKTIIQVLLFFPLFLLTTSLVVVATVCFMIADFQDRRKIIEKELEK